MGRDSLESLATDVIIVKWISVKLWSTVWTDFPGSAQGQASGFVPRL